MKPFFYIPAGRLAGEEYQQPAEPMVEEPQRNGFITFWLWLCFFGSILSAIIGYFNADSISNLGYSSIGSAIFCVVGYKLLLNWRKMGFWIILAQAIIFGCINIYIMNGVADAYSQIGIFIDPMTTVITQVVSIVISSLILFAILQLRKNGKSYWSQLD